VRELTNLHGYPTLSASRAMNSLRQLFTSSRTRWAKIVALFVMMTSLVGGAATPSANLPAELKKDGPCAEMHCARGCCANTVCCAVVQQKQAPQTPTPPPQQHFDLQFGLAELRTFVLLPPPPAPRSVFVTLDETHAAHSLPPLAANCIRLI